MPMPSKSDISEQVAHESERRGRLGVPALAGGVLYLLSGIIIASALKGAPTVGLLEGLAPAIGGVANPSVSPRTNEVKFISHHALGLIAGSALAAVAIGALTLILLMLLDATRFRRPQTWRGAFPLVLGGGIALALVSIGHQVVSALEAHSFAVGHDFSNHAVDSALTTGTANVVTDYLDLLAGLAVAAGMIATTLNAMRVGLLPRWMGMLGMVTGLLIFLPIGGEELEVVPAFWMVMMGILFLGKWPNGDPPAWAAGEARPWPPRSRRAPRGAGSGQPALSTGAGDIAPEPARPAVKATSRKRRRKGGARG
jgi:hypothetical protein